MTSVAESLSAHDLAALRSAVGDALEKVWPDARAAGEPDVDDRVVGAWDALAGMGLAELAGHGVIDALLTVADELGRRGCPVPVADGYAAAVLLGEAAHDEHFRPVLHVAAYGDDAAGRVVRHAEAGPGVSHVVWLDQEAGELRVCPVESRTATTGMARPNWSELTVGDAEARSVDAALVDDAVTVLRLATAARALGAAARTADLAAEQARQRKQFGTTVGAFQAVSHRVVDCAIDVAAGEALLDDAVRLGLADDPSWVMAVELAVEHVVEAAARVQFGAHHTLAAVGYFEEHEGPWLFRRIQADLARLGVLGRGRAGIAELLLAGESLPALGFGPEAVAVRTEVRALVQAAEAEGLRGDDPELVRRLADRGWLGAALPRELGGLDASPELMLAINEELSYWDAAGIARSCSGMLGPSIAAHGTPEQRERFLPLVARGQLPFYLAYSEPETGSDLAHLRTRAVRDGDEWVVNGQKMWGTGAYRAEWGWLAARTDPEATAHEGISIFLFPVDTPGWSLQEHTALSGERSCTTFFDDVRIPDSARVGPLHGGWAVLREALAHERVVIASRTGHLLRLFDELLALLRGPRAAVVGEPGSAERAMLAHLATRLQAARVLGARASTAAMSAHGGVADAPMAKIIGSEFDEEFGVEVLRLLGPDALLEDGLRDDGLSEGWSFEEALRYSIMMVVSGGTNDIQRNLIARSLRMPRS